MPIYEYRCPNGHTFEVIQSMSEDPVTSCETCEAPVERVFHPVAVHFKGSGFYTTDYAKKGSGAKAVSDGGSKGDDSPSPASPDSSSSSPSSAETSAAKGSGSTTKPKSSSGEG